MFQIIEVDAAQSNPEALRKVIVKAVEEGSVAVFRGGGKVFSLDQWSEFLSRDCGFLHDRRHYNFSSSLELKDWWEISYQPEKSISYAYSKTRQPAAQRQLVVLGPRRSQHVLHEEAGARGRRQHVLPVAAPDERPAGRGARTEKPDAAITQLCESFRAFLEKNEATKSVERVHSASGDAFLFHDQKILHGRTAFTADEPFERVLYQSMWRLP